MELRGFRPKSFVVKELGGWTMTQVYNTKSRSASNLIAYFEGHLSQTQLVAVLVACRLI